MGKDVNEVAIPDEITFHYLKTGNYRTYHVDGAYGGVTPSGKIYMELFTERMPTPQQVTHTVEQDGKLGDPTKSEGKDGIIREIEAGIVMDIQTAEKLHGWLQDKLNSFQEQKKEKTE